MELQNLSVFFRFDVIEYAWDIAEFIGRSRSHLDDELEPAFLQVLQQLRLDYGTNQSARAIHFAPLHCEIRVRDTSISGNQSDFCPENVLQHQWVLIANRGGPRRPEDRFLCQHVLERVCGSRPLPNATKMDLLIHASDPAELGGIELRLAIAH